VCEVRKIVTIAVLISVLSASVCSIASMPGGSSGPSRRSTTSVDSEIENLSAQLDLTKKQKSQVKNFLQNQANQFDALQKNSSMSADDKKAEGRDIRANTLAQVRAILNPDQQQKLDDMHLKGIKKKQSLDKEGQ
jgi:Spy/CpxP family protein refolding chaperone